MTKWEYAVLSWQEVWKDGKWDHRLFSFRGTDGSVKQLQQKDHPDSVPILNELGKEGWEVFHVETTNHVIYNTIGDYSYPTAQPVSKTFWLKRPASQEDSHAG